ncbi:hypothetical protein PR048_009368 [Dryococelus australis]|uniref:Reverse transcriptase domain-containing protein n=1 Tax=Dryococelus australis TaxID=614101 RepID=A0ABQ9HZR3_9NEOP|nr:hypothetical protein PR048_009368 [Dryococelus australis]
MNINHYGFRKNISTENAISKVLDIIKNMETKYVMLILIDITNAFSTLESNSIKRAIVRLDIRNTENNLFLDYFKDRSVGILNIFIKFEKKMNRVFNEFLNIQKRYKAESIAFTDDCLIIIGKNNGRALEFRAGE